MAFLPSRGKWRPPRGEPGARLDNRSTEGDWQPRDDTKLRKGLLGVALSRPGHCLGAGLWSPLGGALARHNANHLEVFWAFSQKEQKSAKGMKASGGNVASSDPNQPSGPAALLFIFTALSRSCHCVKGFQALTWRDSVGHQFLHQLR